MDAYYARKLILQFDEQGGGGFQGLQTMGSEREFFLF